MTIYFYKNFVLLKVRVLPRSSKNEIMGEMADGALKVKLTAAPVDGKANEALISLLTEHFNCPKTKIKIVRGQTSKNKVIEILNTKQQMLNKI
ncbi:MAG: YggU family protein [Candidatus Magasanikbacteria bacterium]|nr:YggU family protein [Candidatus Magasanikbacteria bacterium]